MPDDQMNREATLFAMCLLMPADWLKRDADGIDLDDRAAIKRLAQKYRVSEQMMLLRLGQLFS